MNRQDVHLGREELVPRSDLSLRHTKQTQAQSGDWKEMTTKLPLHSPYMDDLHLVKIYFDDGLIGNSSGEIPANFADDDHLWEEALLASAVQCGSMQEWCRDEILPMRLQRIDKDDRPQSRAPGRAAGSYQIAWGVNLTIDRSMHTDIPAHKRLLRWI